jgi:hypothetical protein
MISLFFAYVKNVIMTKLHLYPKVKKEVIQSLLERAKKVDNILNDNKITEVEKMNFTLSELIYIYINNVDYWKRIVILSYQLGKDLKKLHQNLKEGGRKW